MLKGVCPRPQCGRVYWGWALAQPEGQFCNQCGVPLIVSTSVENKIEGRKPWKKETTWVKILKTIKPWELR